MEHFFAILKFFRNFPGPPDLTDAEKCSLAKRYSNPNKPGVVDYRRFDSDITQLDIAEKAALIGASNAVGLLSMFRIIIYFRKKIMNANLLDMRTF